MPNRSMMKPRNLRRTKIKTAIKRKSLMKNRIVRKTRTRKFRRLRISPDPHWGERAHTAGRLAASTDNEAAIDQQKKVNLHWSEWYRSIKRLPWHFMNEVGLRCGEQGQRA